jgi:hypothetical protein
MPTVTSESSGYAYWVADANDPQAIRLERSALGEWRCDRCLERLLEHPGQTFEERATAHVARHLPGLP